MHQVTKRYLKTGKKERFIGVLAPRGANLQVFEGPRRSYCNADCMIMTISIACQGNTPFLSAPSPDALRAFRDAAELKFSPGRCRASARAFAL